MNDLELIKKYYGEKMMHFCREAFPLILENKGELFTLLSKYFAPSKFLYEDIRQNSCEMEFKNLIYNLRNMKEQEQVNVDKTPQQLLNEAGYTLYECHSEEQIQKFKKYYAPNEELCTFRGGRLEKCYVFFAVKKNVDTIKRINFPNPEREDEYGTSVISIQVTREDNILSIKNRYNHRVPNPDATFSNNLDNIIPGLTESFNKEYGFSINRRRNENDLELPGYVRASDGKYYKYNYELHNIYYCPDNIIIDNFRVEKFSKDQYLVMDYFILDLKNKTIKEYDYLNDSFPLSVGKIDTIRIDKDKDSHHKVIIINENIQIVLDNKNRIIKYENLLVNHINRRFLLHNTSLESISLPNVQKIGPKFLQDNEILKEINIPIVEEIGDDFLYSNANNSIKEIHFPKLKTIGFNFMSCNTSIETIDLPMVEEIGAYFLCDNQMLKELNLPKVREIQSDFLNENRIIEKVNLPSLEKIAFNFLVGNRNLKELHLPKLQGIIPSKFLPFNEALEKIEIPNVKMIDEDFLMKNKALKELSLPSVMIIENKFLKENEALSKLSLPKVETIGDDFMPNNLFLEEINFPKVEKIGTNFLRKNQTLKEIKLSPDTSIGKDFLVSHPSIHSDIVIDEGSYYR